MSGPDAAADRLDRGLAELGSQLGTRQRQQLLDLAALLETWSHRFNLTAHRGVEAIVARLVLDALALERELPAAHRIADLGSGAGFPGLPLAVVRPESRVLLVEARERRHHFLRTAVRELALPNAVATRGRIEVLEAEPCDGVVAQALAEPTAALALAIPWCRIGGWIAIPGAETAPTPEPFSEVSRAALHRYRVPVGGPDRTLWIGTRTR